MKNIVKAEPLPSKPEENQPSAIQGVLKNVKNLQNASEISAATKVTPKKQEPENYHHRSNSKNFSSQDETNVIDELQNFNNRFCIYITDMTYFFFQKLFLILYFCLNKFI